MSESRPSLSIVMPSFNQRRFIREAIDSVLTQSYPRLEMIVVDGGSTDGTVEVLSSYGSRIRWVSEKDQGQADALNKGFRMAGGELLGWLNADDLYVAGALEAVGAFFAAHPGTAWAFGHCNIIDEHGREIRKVISDYKARRLCRYSYRSLLCENFISQMGVFMRRTAFDAVGRTFDSSRHWAMDYDLWLRLGARFEPALIDRTLGRFRMYGATKSARGFRKQFEEDFDVARKHAPREHGLLAVHRFNNAKIVTIYYLMGFLDRFRRWPPTAAGANHVSGGVR